MSILFVNNVSAVSADAKRIMYSQMILFEYRGTKAKAAIFFHPFFYTSPSYDFVVFNKTKMMYLTNEVFQFRLIYRDRNGYYTHKQNAYTGIKILSLLHSRPM